MATITCLRGGQARPRGRPAARPWTGGSRPGRAGRGAHPRRPGPTGRAGVRGAITSTWGGRRRAWGPWPADKQYFSRLGSPAANGPPAKTCAIVPTIHPRTSVAPRRVFSAAVRTCIPRPISSRRSTTAGHRGAFRAADGQTRRYLQRSFCVPDRRAPSGRAFLGPIEPLRDARPRTCRGLRNLVISAWGLERGGARGLLVDHGPSTSAMPQTRFRYAL